MNTRRMIRRIVFVTLTLAACSGVSVLLVAAIGRKNRDRCRDYVVRIKTAQNHLFIGEKDVLKLIVAARGRKIKDEPITDFNLRKLEQTLKENAWIENANLYFDNREVLHISVTEKEPIARIFTTSGKSFYIDKTGKQMPLSDKMSARLPVFTSFPGKKFLSDKDSALLRDIATTASFILKDPFWMAQTEQVDITEQRTFELVPTVGNHIVKLGNADDIDKKFHRLLVFYQQVMSKTGFDKYNYVDVQWSGQVIGGREKLGKVDSIQLRKNVEKLLKEAEQMQKDTTIGTPFISTANLPEEEKNPGPLKTSTDAKPKLIANRAEKKAKALMPQKVN